MTSGTENILTIDVGNSSTKCALWKEGRIVSRPSLISLNDHELQNFLCGISQVGKLSAKEEKLLRKLKAQAQLTFQVKDHFHQNSFLEMPVHYAPTLGPDRLIAAYEIFRDFHSSHYAQSRSLVIDAGSFITLDLVSKKGFEGGYIFPSQHKWQQAYTSGFQLKNHLKTKNLDFDTKKLSQLPQKSEDAINFSYSLALVGLFSQLSQHYTPSRVFFTGGGAAELFELFKDHGLKLPGFELRSDLIHEGLYKATQELCRGI